MDGDQFLASGKVFIYYPAEISILCGFFHFRLKTLIYSAETTLPSNFWRLAVGGTNVINCWRHARFPFIPGLKNQFHEDSLIFA